MVQIEGISKRIPSQKEGIRRNPKGILLERFRIEGTAKGMHNLGKMRNVGGEWVRRLPFMARVRLMGGSRRMGFVHGFYNFCLQLLSPSPSLGQKKELVHVYEASYASESQPLFNPYLTLI